MGLFFWPSDLKAADRRLQRSIYCPVTAFYVLRTSEAPVVVGAVGLWETERPARGGRFSKRLWETERPARGGRFSKAVVGGLREGHRDRRPAALSAALPQSPSDAAIPQSS